MCAEVRKHLNFVTVVTDSFCHACSRKWRNSGLEVRRKVRVDDKDLGDNNRQDYNGINFRDEFHEESKRVDGEY